MHPEKWYRKINKALKTDVPKEFALQADTTFKQIIFTIYSKEFSTIDANHIMAWNDVANLLKTMLEKSIIDEKIYKTGYVINTYWGVTSFDEDNEGKYLDTCKTVFLSFIHWFYSDYMKAEKQWQQFMDEVEIQDTIAMEITTDETDKLLTALQKVDDVLTKEIEKQHKEGVVKYAIHRARQKRFADNS